MKKEKSKKRRKTAKRILAVILVFVICITANGFLRFFPHLAVINDAVALGVDYIDLNLYKDAPSKSEIKNKISEFTEIKHPFVLVGENNFDAVRKEYESDSGTEYTKALTESVIANANGLLDTAVYPVLS